MGQGCLLTAAIRAAFLSLIARAINKCALEELCPLPRDEAGELSAIGDVKSDADCETKHSTSAEFVVLCFASYAVP